MFEEVIITAQNIKMIAFDCDGVLTDGSLTFDENGIEYKTFNAKDGQGIVMTIKAGIPTALITARKNGTVAYRAKNLGITKLFEGIKNKEKALIELCEEYNILPEEIAYMGDDLPDICVLEKVGLACCPNDAIDDVKNICNFVSTKNGGKGAIRELTDFILKAQNKYCITPVSLKI